MSTTAVSNPLVKLNLATLQKKNRITVSLSLREAIKNSNAVLSRKASAATYLA